MHANKWRSSTSEFRVSLQACLFAALLKMKALYAQMSHGYKANTRSQATSAARRASVARCIKMIPTSPKKDDVEETWFSEVSGAKFGQITLFCWAKISSKTATGLYFELKIARFRGEAWCVSILKVLMTSKLHPKLVRCGRTNDRSSSSEIQRRVCFGASSSRRGSRYQARRKWNLRFFEFALDAFDFHAALKCAEVPWIILFQQLCPPAAAAAEELRRQARDSRLWFGSVCRDSEGLVPLKFLTSRAVC